MSKDNYRREWFGRSDTDQLIIDVVDDVSRARSIAAGVISAVVVFVAIGFIVGGLRLW